MFRILTVLISMQATLVLAQTPEAEEERSKAERLRSLTNNVRSIDPIDDDFSDLDPLIEKIGTSRVVVLGEATHSHGTTSRAKARLVRFLHKRMGFDVLAWESGLLQTYAMNTALRHHTASVSQAKAYLMAGGWASEEDVHPVFEYARGSWQTGRPLEMAGFDAGKPQMTAPFFRRFFTSMAKRAPWLAISESDWALVESLNKRGYGFISAEMPTEAVRNRERPVVEKLLATLRTTRSRLLTVFAEREFALAERFALDALSSEHLNHPLLRSGGGPWNEARDRFMADNLLWKMKTLYPGREVIVWAATAHLIRNSTSIKNQENSDWCTSNWEMGNHLYPILGKDLYTIAFTSYKGKAGDIFPPEYGVETRVNDVPPAPPGSFESIAHELKQKYFFVDLRGSPSSHWLKQQYVSVALGRLVNSAKWSEVVDAFFFIDEAEPNKHLPRKP